MRAAIVVLSGLLGGGCMSFSARAQVGPVADGSGRAGFTAMLTAGYGWAGERTALGWTAGAESEPGQGVRVVTSVDAARLHGEEWAVRAGGHAISAMKGHGPESFGFHAALLHPLRGRSRAPGDGDPLLVKEFTHLFVGVDTRAGVRVVGNQEYFEAGCGLTVELLYKMDEL